MDGFRAQVAEKEYRRMVSSVDPNASSSVANNLRQDLKDLKDVKAHTIGIINVLYTGGAVFTAVFLISAHFTQDLGMVCAFVVSMEAIRIDADRPPRLTSTTFFFVQFCIAGITIILGIRSYCCLRVVSVCAPFVHNRSWVGEEADKEDARRCSGHDQIFQ